MVVVRSGQDYLGLGLRLLECARKMCYTGCTGDTEYAYPTSRSLEIGTESM